MPSIEYVECLCIWKMVDVFFNSMNWSFYRAQGMPIGRKKSSSSILGSHCCHQKSVYWKEMFLRKGCTDHIVRKKDRHLKNENCIFPQYQYPEPTTLLKCYPKGGSKCGWFPGILGWLTQAEQVAKCTLGLYTFLGPRGPSIFNFQL